VRALLAEDNEANQMVATELLSRLGIELDIAENGRVAVEKVRSSPGRYAAVLMDMQMPEMDGLAATRAIRADPAFGELPIIAMTANAMKADLDACLAAGMNDHVTKPIDRKALVATLRRWLPAGRQGGGSEPAPVAVELAPPEPAAPEGPPALEGIDVPGALDRLGLDFPSLSRMLVRFAEGQRGVLDALRSAVDAADAAAAARHAHAIAGAAGNLGASGLRAAAKELETAGREGRGADLPALRAEVEAQAAVVLRSIASLGEQSEPPAATPRAPFDPAAALSALRRLEAALGDFDLSAATGALGELEGMALSAETAQLRALRRHVDAYEYDEARGVVARVAGAIEGEGR
jgi:two-component system sensor histidine kinase/response regulator